MKTEKEYKTEIQDLRTELNKFKKCVKSINHISNHIKSESYDYGQGYENAIVEIRDAINFLENEVNRDIIQKYIEYW